MASIVFDIETGPLSEDELRGLYDEITWEEFSASCNQRWKTETRRAKFEEAIATGWQQFVEKAALSPLTGRVLAIGLVSDEAGHTIIGSTEEKTGGSSRDGEWHVLRQWWGVYLNAARRGDKLIGFNIAAFDLPFIVRRSWMLDITVPDGVVYASRNYLKSHQSRAEYCDLLQVWQMGDKQKYISLDRLCRLFGLHGKIVCDPDTGKPLTGRDFARLYTSHDRRHRDAAREYLLVDVDLTWHLGIRLGVI